MLLLHRLTPFAIGLIIGAGFSLAYVFPLQAIWLLIVVLLTTSTLIGRLLEWHWVPERFILASTPILFTLSACLVFLLVDSANARVGIALAATMFSYLYAEHLFRFLHLPAVYQAYGLQNMTSIMGLHSIFFFSASASALLLFVRLPLAAVVAVFFLLVWVITYNAFWSAKAPTDRTLLYATAGAILLAQCLTAVSYLPSVFMTNGALLTIAFYVFTGVSRAHVLAKLSKTVIKRYVGVGALILVVLIVSTRWI